MKECTSRQLSLFEEQKQEGFPILMEGRWLDKYPAIALVDTPEHKQELLNIGYKEMEKL
jgi:hypothetical protein